MSVFKCLFLTGFIVSAAAFGAETEDLPSRIYGAQIKASRQLSDWLKANPKASPEALKAKKAELFAEHDKLYREELAKDHRRLAAGVIRAAIISPPQAEAPAPRPEPPRKHGQRDLAKGKDEDGGIAAGSAENVSFSGPGHAEASPSPRKAKKRD